MTERLLRDKSNDPYLNRGRKSTEKHRDLKATSTRGSGPKNDSAIEEGVFTS